VLREVLAQAQGPVAALGLTNQRETVVVWERDTGRPIAPAIVWQDRRTADVCASLKEAGHEAGVRAATGLGIDPYFSATKIAWLLDRTEGARERANAGALACGTIDTWLVWRLTGGRVYATDATNASRTLLFDIHQGGWSEVLCLLFGAPLAMLPEVRDTAGDFGETAAEVLGRSIPIRACVGDQQSALLGQGCLEPGQTKATFGTGAFILTQSGATAPTTAGGLLATVAARVAGRTTYASEGAIFNAGAVIQWLNEGLGVAGGPKAVEALARSARGDHGVLFVPAFTGLGAPWWEPGARGALFGLTRDSGLPEIAAAAFDACAYQTRDLLDLMRGAGARDAVVRIDGGMASSAFFAQRLADLLGAPVDRALYSETTALGAALFAAVGAGLLSVEEAAERRPPAERLEPRLDPTEREAAYARWRAVVGRVVAAERVG
jgi:glycerol kinase